MSIEFEALSLERENPDEEGAVANNDVDFTSEEGYGKYLDLHECYIKYTNLKGVDGEVGSCHRKSFCNLYCTYLLTKGVQCETLLKKLNCPLQWRNWLLSKSMKKEKAICVRSSENYISSKDTQLSGFFWCPNRPVIGVHSTRTTRNEHSIVVVTPLTKPASVWGLTKQPKPKTFPHHPHSRYKPEKSQS